MIDPYQLDSYDYYLPEERIAQFPPENRGDSRLLAMLPDSSGSFHLEDAKFSDLINYLPENALLVANNAKVLPCRLNVCGPQGGKGEFLLLSPLPELLQAAQIRGQWRIAQAECLLRPARRFHPGGIYELCDGLQMRVLEKQDFGRHKIELRWQGNLEELFLANGKLPLPPYIRRAAFESDHTRYQTCYATRQGAAAAPTAGLHFTPELHSVLQRRGIEWRELTLYVGYGTFTPVRCQDLRQHKMHAELLEIDAASAQAINQAKLAGRPIIAIGTTSLRALESAYDEAGNLQACKKWTDIFIYPGYQFKIVDALITNFHLPKSSLLMLVAAFAGHDAIMRAYRHAIARKYNFFSYGDAMLIQRNQNLS